MKNKWPCELIQDLFPSYIEGLTSDVTNAAVEEHIAECENCKKTLERMKEPEEVSMEPEDEKEIDFLKKTRRRNRGIIVGSVLTVAAAMIIIVLTKIFLIGNDLQGESISCHIQIEGEYLTLTAVAEDERLGISAVSYTEEDGMVTISFQGVKESLFHHGEFQSEYTADSDITQVCIDDRIIWDHGETISAVTSAVYNTRHAYIGDMSLNGKTAAALNVSNYLGNFTNELQTGTEPYGWTMLLEEEITTSQKESKENAMKSYGYIILAVIDNLGEVSWEYTVDGEKCVLSITEEEASSFAGCDIKTCGQDIRLLQELIEKTGFVIGS